MSADTQSLTAGREMDALVAEKVMGWRRGNTKHGQYPWITAHGGQRLMVPEYSTDIAAAWMVVEKMREEFGQGLHCHYEFGKSQQWVAEFVNADDEDWTGESLGDTAPVAICRAALSFFSGAQ